MNKTTKKPELLCPAGSKDAFAAAIDGGADAIYVGASSFNARMNAKNLGDDDLCECVKLAHAYGVKVYLTLNTLIYDKELDEFLRVAEKAYLNGADALIIADLGASQLIRERIPIDLHASTQMSGHGLGATKYLSELGFTRMVAARELSGEDLALLTKESPIEIEAFVHGALCVCHSGQCLFSSLVGGRSGNRGECAQPCRLPFGSKNKYPLSLKDLSLAQHTKELCDMGIASFKIEGRMKSPEYVRDVARIWRRLIDERRNADAAEMKRLAEIFSRGGFTDGYYTKNIGKNMLGVRSEDDKTNTRALLPFTKIERRIPLDLTAIVKVGEPMTLTVSAGGKTVSVTGATPDAAINSPLSKEAVEKNLAKLGSTPYEARNVSVLLDGDPIAPISAINKLRRDAIELLMTDTQRSEADIRKNEDHQKYNGSETVKGRSAYFKYADRIPPQAYDFFDTVYVPIEDYDGKTNGAALPPVIMDCEKEKISKLIARAEGLGCQHLLIGNLGHLSLAKNSKMKLHGDMRLNVANTKTAILLDELLSDYVLSPELTLPKIRDIRRATRGAVVQTYGRTPLMVTEKCVGKEISTCDKCESGEAKLTDRRGISFPVAREFEHRSVIFNSVPTYMADRQRELYSYGIRAEYFIFSTESKNEIRDIIKAYNDGLPPKGDVRRIKA